MSAEAIQSCCGQVLLWPSLDRFAVARDDGEAYQIFDVCNQGCRDYDFAPVAITSGNRRLTLGLSINGYRTRVATVAEFQRELESFAGEAFREVWIDVKNGPAICALFNGGIGWLLYMRESGDAGFSSRNPDYQGKTDAMLEFRLSNGQDDVYPASWALTERQVIQALEYFVECRQRAPFIQWHDDSA